MKQHSQKFLQQRKLVMAIPILVMPFLTMIFWALGGGQVAPVQAKAIEQTGLNLELPSAHFSETEWTDKFSLYEQVHRDSAKFMEAVENDPYFDLNTIVLEENPQQQINQNPKLGSGETQATNGKLSNDPNEEKVNQKLELLYKELNKTPVKPSSQGKQESMIPPIDNSQFASDVTKLESMMEMMNRGTAADSEMQKIEGVLDKILDIQHPERVKEKIKEQSLQNKDRIFSVTTDKGDELLSDWSQASESKIDSTYSVSRFVARNSFYDLEDDTYRDKQNGSTIEAVVHDTQEVVAGSTMKFRLLHDIYVNGSRIPKDQFVYGVANFADERLTISISSIRFENSLFPVELSVYDLDGMEGIYAPGAITRDAAKQSSDQALQGMQMFSMDPSVSAQAASAGIQAAKGLLSQKVKTIRVTVKAGYRILLMGDNVQDL